MQAVSKFPVSFPLRVGLVGTGYAAKVRAETLQADERVQVVAVAGHTQDKTIAFCESFQAQPCKTWAELVAHPEVDLVVIATVNRDHGTIARAALEAGKHVVVEYPLSVDVAEAKALIDLAHTRAQFLHVEHIELLSGIHRAVVDNLAAIGSVFHVRYVTIQPQKPAPDRWTYYPDLFGFPLIGAVSRLQRLIDLFGRVASVSCQTRYWTRDGFAVSLSHGLGSYAACICVAQLRFTSGLVAELVYGKGETLWLPGRTLEIHGEKGAIVIEGEDGKLIQGDRIQPIEVGSRRGLFARDTKMLLDHLATGTPMYITPEISLYALQVADAARQSAETGLTISLC